MRVGADINLTPNAVRALDGLGEAVAQGIRASGARPTFRISRDWDTGLETSRLPMGDTAEQRYGAPQLTIHRADVLAVMANAEAGQLLGQPAGVAIGDVAEQQLGADAENLGAHNLTAPEWPQAAARPGEC